MVTKKSLRLITPTNFEFEHQSPSSSTQSTITVVITKIRYWE